MLCWRHREWKNEPQTNLSAAPCRQHSMRSKVHLTVNPKCMMFEDPPSKDWSIIPDNWDSLTTKFYEWLKVKGKVSHSVVSDSFVTPWTVAHQAPLTMGFSRQEYWSRWPFPSPGDLPDPGNWTQVSCIAGRVFTNWAMGSKKYNRPLQYYDLVHS